jgi:2,2-dialkylglycine decarboxylase (pyruvate)
LQRSGLPIRTDQASKPREIRVTRTDELLALAKKHLIRFHPVEKERPIIGKALGSRVWDVEGVEYIDFVSGQLSSTTGHNHPRVVEAIRKVIERQIHSSAWLLHEESILLAEAYSKVLPEALGTMMFKNSGTEANEAAISMAKMVTGGFEILSPNKSFFGNTAASRSNTSAFGRKGYGPGMPGAMSMVMPYCYRCPLAKTFPDCKMACLDVSFELFDSQSVGAGAAVIIEPILGAGGIVEPPPGYLAALKQKTHERGMHLIYDEAQTGMGRVGQLFGFMQSNVLPDYLSLSKTIGGGAPLSCVATSKSIETEAFKRGFTGGSTHANDPLICAAGHAVLNVVLDEDLPAQALQKGEYLRRHFEKWSQEFEMIGDIRGRGLLMGVEFVKERESKEPAEAEGALFSQMCLERGLIVSVIRMPGMNSVCRMAPPLTISTEELDRALEVMESVFRDIKAQRRTAAQ